MDLLKLRMDAISLLCKIMDEASAEELMSTENREVSLSADDHPLIKSVFNVLHETIVLEHLFKAVKSLSSGEKARVNKQVAICISTRCTDENVLNLFEMED